MGHHSHGWANGYSQNWMKVGDLTVIMEMLVVSMTNVWGFKPFQIKWNIEHWRYRLIRVCYLKTGYWKYPQICGLDTNLQLFEIEMWISDLKNWVLNQNDGDFRSIVHFCGVSCIQKHWFVWMCGTSKSHGLENHHSRWKWPYRMFGSTRMRISPASGRGQNRKIHPKIPCHIHKKIMT
jgi:hypothetical protein